MVASRRVLRVGIAFLLLTGLAVFGSTLGSNSAGASSTCYPPGSKTCTASLSASPTDVNRGGTITVSGSGFKGDTQVSINACSVASKTVTTERAGNFSTSLTLPHNTPVGPCSITASGTSSDGGSLTLSTSVFVHVSSSTSLSLSSGTVRYSHESSEQLSVSVAPAFPKSWHGSQPAGRVRIREVNSGILICQFHLSGGTGSCNLGDRQLGAGNTYHLIAYYDGNSTFDPSASGVDPVVVRR